MPSRRVKQGQGPSSKDLTTRFSSSNEERISDDVSTVYRVNGEKTGYSFCPAGALSSGQANVHVGPASRSNAKVDAFDCPSISALPSLLNVTADDKPTLEEARRSCAELELDLMGKQENVNYYDLLHEKRQRWEEVLELKPAKFTENGYSFCAFCSSFLPACVEICPRCGLKDDNVKQSMNDHMNTCSNNKTERHLRRSSVSRHKKAL